MSKTKKKKDVQVVVAKVADQVTMAKRKSLRRDKDNPRVVPEHRVLAIMQSIVEFGFKDPLHVRKEDNLILGGHGRDTAVERLLAGPFTYKPAGAEESVTVQWQLPNDELPVIYVEGLSDAKARLFNFALNNGGDWEHDMVATALRQLSEGGYDLDVLSVTGFSPAELTDYIDIADELSKVTAGGDDGQAPRPTQKSPKLDLEFSSKEARDAVKAAVAAKAREGELSGDTLARMLGVRVKRGK